jgi:2-dehydro-3-deoxyphosphogluconate aldolase/(4S)-4-hydroxy-2-oxoglutarate aldolase
MNTDQLMSAGPVIPVLTIDDPEHAVPLARALCASGVRVLEITLRTEAALEAVRRVAREVPEAIPGVGTVTRAEDFTAARGAGAHFAVSPGFSPELAAAAGNLPWLPGVSTASEVMAAQRLGYHRLKFFPAAAMGGTATLKALSGPFGDVRFCPTGGIDAGNASDYLALANVACVGGSWLAPPDAIAAGAWDRITGLAGQANSLARNSK